MLTGEVMMRLGAVVLAAMVMAAGPAVAEGEGVPIPPDVIMQAPYTGAQVRAGRAGDGWTSFTPNGCITYYDGDLKQMVTMMSTREGRWFGSTLPGGVAALNTACAVAATMMFQLEGNTWTQWLIQANPRLAQ
ncbi:MAG: hypothetical protein J0H82_04570 [Alphaproteobacteria bacterium]|jgi:uncharacterized membrane protein|nr:hypothetical protein [Alphaproteobacteria bacterium]